MKYMGSKARIAKHILPIILDGRRPNQWYVEPFCGGMNTMDKVGGLRLAADNNVYLIAMWRGLLNNWPILEITRELYVRARNEYNWGGGMLMSDFEIGWVGWMGSFNGRFFDGGYSGKHKGRDYVAEQVKNTLGQIKNLKGVRLTCCDYAGLAIPSNSIIYCDIPYAGTKQYVTSKTFNHSEFWDWCRRTRDKGHTVFVSEYDAPKDISCVWEMEVTNSMHPTTTRKPVEKLYKV